ncbi:MAG: caspase family protein [Thermoplasmatota archaeon]
MKNSLFRKTLVIVLLALLTVTGLSTFISSNYKMEAVNVTIDTVEQPRNSTIDVAYPDDGISLKTVGGDGNTKYWAVIATAGANAHQVILSTRDAEQLYDILVAHNWEENNIKLLIEEEATRGAVMNTFQWLNESGEDADDVIFFFFSFHGFHMEDKPPFDEPDGQDGFLAPFGFDFETWENAILDDELAAEFNKLKSKNIFAIIHSCHSGEFIDGTSDLCNSGRVVLTSCAADETSCPIYAKMQWLYAYYIIKGFKGSADNNKDNWVSAEEAFSYAKLPTQIRSTIFTLISPQVPFTTQHPQIYDGWPTEENHEDDLNIIDMTK